ncbi:LacI family DNA-binding transcriptional regulator [Pelagicoccus sp. SDUM812003]|uniref:LacI family DNA-binding transcriptional regulator n=1 Tax=Pelagicoccus sp. SDUM812003 TaxID=3041267 RepID=UPI00280C622F|nr:LacI family DNA-binding transcriptional regulator [Pelagicoccus sp. SDUM812003]MDQ8201927.1 LacI family DNA-binding transcriptional regulator [Pelagicoccus sp. SDUM812003]
MPIPRNNPRKRAPTLADVGRAAGVSAMAVSAVLNGASSSVRISEETQKRIRKAAKELNYRPNIAARALVNRRMNTLGVFFVVEDHELNNYFLAVFNGIIDAASKYQQNVTVFTLDTWSDAKSQLEKAFDGRIDGMILIAPVVTAEFASGLDPNIPAVSLHANAEVDGMINIESDERTGAREMVELLLRKGHRRVMHLSGPRGLIGVERRIDGYREALQAQGVKPEEKLLVSTDYSEEGGRSKMRAWLKKNQGLDLPDAIFCANDSIALGCIEALAEAGIRVPDDVSVCGFDDTLIARATVPQLTTVRQPLKAMGAEAVDILMKRISNGEDAIKDLGKVVVHPTVLVERSSVRDLSAS